MSDLENVRLLVPNIKAVIFDMDGVLVDSEEQHFLAHKRALAAFGVRLNKKLYAFHGVSRDPKEFYQIAMGKKGMVDNLLGLIQARKNRIFQLLQKKKGVQGGSDAIALAKWLFTHKIPIAVATNMDMDTALRQLKELGIDKLFTHIVSADGIAKKPAPDVYRKAVHLLGIPRSQCLALEDSATGVQAAVEAGIHCIAVPGEMTRHHDFTRALAVLTSRNILDIWQSVSHR